MPKISFTCSAVTLRVRPPTCTALGGGVGLRRRLRYARLERQGRARESARVRAARRRRAPAERQPRRPRGVADPVAPARTGRCRGAGSCSCCGEELSGSCFCCGCSTGCCSSGCCWSGCAPWRRRRLEGGVKAGVYRTVPADNRLQVGQPGHAASPPFGVPGLLVQPAAWSRAAGSSPRPLLAEWGVSAVLRLRGMAPRNGAEASQADAAGAGSSRAATRSVRAASARRPPQTVRGLRRRCC